MNEGSKKAATPSNHGVTEKSKKSNGSVAKKTDKSSESLAKKKNSPAKQSKELAPPALNATSPLAEKKFQAFSQPVLSQQYN